MRNQERERKVLRRDPKVTPRRHRPTGSIICSAELAKDPKTKTPKTKTRYGQATAPARAPARHFRCLDDI